MKYLLSILLFGLSLISLRAGEVDKPADAFATWTDIVVRKDIGKWHVGGLVEYCTVNKGAGLKHDEFTIRPIVGYNPLSWLRFQLQVDFLNSLYGDYAFYIRCLPDMTFHWSSGDFRFSLRNRLQMSHNITKRKYASTVVRNRFKVDYIIKDTPVRVHLAAEPYWWADQSRFQDCFIKTRYYLGADFTLTKQLSLTTDYIRYQHYRPGAPNHNVFILALNVRL